MNKPRGLPPNLLALDEVPEDDEGLRDAFVVRFGPRCAAWLVNSHRRRLRRTGVMFFHVATGADLPPWFRIARDYLRRSKKWFVEEKRDGKVRRFAFYWQTTKFPPSIVPVGRC